MSGFDLAYQTVRSGDITTGEVDVSRIVSYQSFDGLRA
jgi:hypothetical protein